MASYVCLNSSDGLAAIQFYESQGTPRDCRLCTEVSRDSGSSNADETPHLLKTDCCSEIFHENCLEHWANSQESAPLNKHKFSKFDCPSCSKALNGSYFYRITEEDYHLAQLFKSAIDSRDYRQLETLYQRHQELSDSSSQPLTYPFTRAETVHYAAQEDVPEALSFCKEKKLVPSADFHAKKRGFYCSPLFTAAAHSSNKAAKFLLEWGANPDGTKSGRPLNAAMATANSELLSLLENKGVNFTKKDDEGRTCLLSLYLGALNNLDDILQFEAQNYAKPLLGRLINKIAYTFLLTSPITPQVKALCSFKQLELDCVRKSLDGGVDLKQMIPHPFDQKRKAKVIHLATRIASMPAFQLILDKTDEDDLRGPSSAILYQEENTLDCDPPIFEAIFSENIDLEGLESLHGKMGCPEIIRRSLPPYETLLNEAISGAMDPNFTKRFSSSRLIEEKLSYLFENQNIEGINLEGHTALHKAAFFVDTANSTHRKYLDQLWEKAQSKNQYPTIVMDAQGLVPLNAYIATHEGDTHSEKIVEKLSEYTINRKEPNYGNTPLHQALLYNLQGSKNRKTIQDLLCAKADEMIPNNMGQRPRFLSELGKWDVLSDIYENNLSSDDCFKEVTENPDGSKTLHWRKLLRRSNATATKK